MSRPPRCEHRRVLASCFFPRSSWVLMGLILIGCHRQPTAPAVQPQIAKPIRAKAPRARPSLPVAPRSWVDHCAKALTTAKGDRYFRWTHPWFREGTVSSSPAAVEFSASSGPSKLTIAIRTTTTSTGPKLWVTSTKDSSVTHTRQRDDVLATITSDIRDGPNPASLTFLADRCLEAVEHAPIEHDAADGTVLEGEDLKLVSFGEDALVVGRFFRGAIVDAGPGGSRLSAAPALPADFDLGWHESLSGFDCGNGDRLLVAAQGWAFAPDSTMSPRARWWRRSSSKWSRAEQVKGIVAGCGPSWTLVAVALRSDRGFHWRFDVHGSISGDSRPPNLAPSKIKGCPHRLELQDVLALPSGRVVAAGNQCRRPGAKRAPAVEVFQLGSSRGRFKRLPSVTGGAWLTWIEGSGTHLEIHSIMEFMENSPGKNVAAFDGRRWIRATDEYGEPTPSVLLARAHRVQRIGGELWRRGTKGKWLVATIPEPRHPRVAEPLPPRYDIWQRIVSVFESKSGDVWLLWSVDETDCGGCFSYRSLARVPAAAFRASDQGPSLP